MEKPVIISVRSSQVLQDGQKDQMELVSQGTLAREGEAMVLSYEESELTGLEGTTTTFRVEPHRIVLLREGTLNSEMIFQEGQKHVSLYQTPYGALMLGVNTHKAVAHLTEAGGTLSIRYGMEADGETMGENAFEIQVTQPQ